MEVWESNEETSESFPSAEAEALLHTCDKSVAFTWNGVNGKALIPLKKNTQGPTEPDCEEP